MTKRLWVPGRFDTAQMLLDDLQRAIRKPYGGSMTKIAFVIACVMAVLFGYMVATALAGDYDTPRPYDHPVPPTGAPPVACQLNPNGC